MLKLTTAGLALDYLPDSVTSIDVRFDGRRVWSVDVRDRGTEQPLQLEWPGVLIPFLTGRTTLSLTDSATGTQFAVRDVDFGQSADLEPAAFLEDARHRVSVSNEAGHALVVNKWGHLGVTLETMGADAQTLIVNQSRKLVEQLSDLGLRPFVVGGTLLGAVRDGRLLPHDDDADIAYLSRHTHPADVAQEAFEVGHQLEALGYEIKRHSATHMQLLFRDSGGALDHYIDVFSAFFTYDGNINQPFHVRGQMAEEQMLPFSTVAINAAGIALEFPAPADTDRWLTINYDENWRTPLPGFQLVTPVETRRRFDNWFGGFNFHRDSWDDFFEGRRADAETKDSLWVPGRGWLYQQTAESGSPVILDLGCGQGELTHRIASQHMNSRVIGLDYSAAALSAASRVNTASQAEFAKTNVYRLASLAVTHELNITTAFDVVSNHLFEQVNHRARPQAWRILRMALRSGGRAHFTFHAQHAPDVTADDPTGWHLTPQQVTEEATQYGLGVTFSPLGSVQGTAGRTPIGASVHLLSTHEPAPTEGIDS